MTLGSPTGAFLDHRTRIGALRERLKHLNRAQVLLDRFHPQLAEQGYASRICGKGARNPPLTEAQKASNHEKSKARSRVEHVFGAQHRGVGISCAPLDYLVLR